MCIIMQPHSRSDIHIWIKPMINWIIITYNDFDNSQKLLLNSVDVLR
jgi:hypothetical protein